MPDPVVTFADQAKQLLADFQHAMDSNAPVSIVMMTELKRVLDAGVGAHEDREILTEQLTATEQKAAKIAKDMQADANELVATIHHGGE
jgi:hypothetical protein